MKILRAIFEESLKAQVNADGNVEFGCGDAEFTPVEILKSDDEQYKSEFVAWLNDVWLDRNRQRLSSLLKLHGNDGRFTDLCNAVSANNVVPLVGSGMSRASGFPLWREFLHQLRQDTRVTEAALNILLDAGHYEEAVDVLAADAGRHLFDERIEQGLRVDDPSEVLGPVRLLADIFPRLVMSTNLDDVLEHVFKANEHPFAHVLAGRDIERYRQLVNSPQPILLKIHGDCRRNDGRVLGAAEYDAAYAVGSAPREALTLLCRARALLWLGCSLTIDRTVMLMEQVVAADPAVPRHYAFLRLPPDDARRVERGIELGQRKIFPIWYDGDDDEAIEALLVGILDRTGRFATAGDA
jgi:hypothetical protein